MAPPGHALTLQGDVELLLGELCVKLGFCLPPEERRRLAQLSPPDVDGFTDAVFEAEGLGKYAPTALRRQVRTVVEVHMRRWAAAEGRASEER